jgi:hypothetical protein
LPAGSNSTGILKSVDGGTAVLIQTSLPLTATTYTDAAVQAGRVYTYRFKNHPSVASNLVTCPSGGATPTPTGTVNPNVPPAGTIAGQCTGASTPRIVVRWSKLPPPGSLPPNSDGLERWVDNSGWQFVEPMTPVDRGQYWEYTDTAIQLNSNYRYRAKYRAETPSSNEYSVLATALNCGGVATPVPTPTSTSLPSATPAVSINPIPNPLQGALGVVSGTATDDRGITQVRVVLRQGPSGVLISAANPDWNGSQFVNNNGTRVEFNAIGTTNWSFSQTPPASQMIVGQQYTFYAYAIDTDNQSSGTGLTFVSFTYQGPTPTPVSTVVPTPTSTGVVTPIPTPTPGAQDSLMLNVVGRNASTGTAESSTVSALGNQEVEVITRIRNTHTEAILNGVTARAGLPSGLVYVAGSSSINNVPTSVDGITSGGLALGALGAQQEIQVRFRARVNGPSFPAGQSQAAITMNATAVGAPTRTGQITVLVNRPTSSQPGTVPTGPGDAVFVALLASAIMTLFYVSYTRSSVFRRHEVEHISRDQGPMDFRS